MRSCANTSTHTIGACASMGPMLGSLENPTRTLSGVCSTKLLPPLQPSSRCRCAQSLNIISANAVIDGEVKFAPGTIFQQPPNTKSQTLLGCLKSGIPLEDFVLGGAGPHGSGGGPGSRKDSAAKRDREMRKDRDRDLDERQVSQREPHRQASGVRPGVRNPALVSMPIPMDGRYRYRAAPSRDLDSFHHGCFFLFLFCFVFCNLLDQEQPTTARARFTLRRECTPSEPVLSYFAAGDVA